MSVCCTGGLCVIPLGLILYVHPLLWPPCTHNNNTWPQPQILCTNPGFCFLPQNVHGVSHSSQPGLWLVMRPSPEPCSQHRFLILSVSAISAFILSQSRYLVWSLTTLAWPAASHEGPSRFWHPHPPFPHLSLYFSSPPTIHRPNCSSRPLCPFPIAAPSLISLPWHWKLQFSEAAICSPDRLLMLWLQEMMMYGLVWTVNIRPLVSGETTSHTNTPLRICVAKLLF